MCVHLIKGLAGERYLSIEDCGQGRTDGRMDGMTTGTRVSSSTVTAGKGQQRIPLPGIVTQRLGNRGGGGARGGEDKAGWYGMHGCIIWG